MAIDYKALRAARSGKAQENKSSNNKPTKWQWVKCGIAIALWLVFCYWLSSWMGLLVVPFIYDIYITKKIKWTWWKELESDVARVVMSWVDAIVFALVAVYFVNNFFFQNYQIPSSSLEKSLLTGDYLLVSKVSYGPRIPQTPLTMPLTQHTMPVLGTKSYIEWPQWEYRRAKGLGKVELGDIVVFNYPAGDTVAIAYPGDYYDLCYSLGCQSEANDSLQSRGIPYENRDIEALGTDFAERMRHLSGEEQQKYFAQRYEKGKRIVASNTNQYGSVTTRPADRRENYVKRCVGLPGQTLQIIDKQIFIDGKQQKEPSLVQFNYRIKAHNNQYISDELCEMLGISEKDRDDYYYHTGNGMPLTREAAKQLAANKAFCDSLEEVKDGYWGNLYPVNCQQKDSTGRAWTRDNYGPVWIPAKGQSIALTLDNLPLYERPIRTYEGNKLEVKDGRIYINDKEVVQYTFKMDYYWMMGDNRHNSADSRYWGFVPEDHIVGKPQFIWLSVESHADGSFKRIRWDRLFKSVDKIK